MNGPTVCIAVNKDDSEIGHSETFIRAHIERMPTRVIPLIGNPGIRKAPDGYLWGQSMLQRAVRSARRWSTSMTTEQLEAPVVANWLRANDVRVVMAEYGNSAVGIMRACQLANVPLVAHFHGYDVYAERMRATLGQRYRELFARSAAIIAVSQDMRRALCALGAPDEKISVVPCGADASAGRTARPDAAPPHFVAVGRFVEKKAPMLTLLAFARARERAPDATLTFIGDGPLLEATRQIARGLGLEGSVSLTGALSHADTLATLARARALVQHSVQAADGDKEGTPVSVMEALASGLPVISTRHGGITDVVVEGETGLLGDEFDLDGMADAIVRIAQDPALAARLGEAGHASSVALWSMDRSMEKLWAVVERASRG